MQNSKAAVAWKLRTRTLDLTRPRIMGIVNVTPDSFSDGGEHATTEAAVAWGRKLAADGADIIDVGGESTRPGAADVSLEEELARVIPVVKTLAREGLIVSVDTSKPEVMREAAAAGAEILNDIRGFREAGGASGCRPKRLRPHCDAHAGDAPHHAEGPVLHGLDRRSHRLSALAGKGAACRRRRPRGGHV